MDVQYFEKEAKEVLSTALSSMLNGDEEDSSSSCDCDDCTQQ